MRWLPVLAAVVATGLGAAQHGSAQCRQIAAVEVQGDSWGFTPNTPFFSMGSDEFPPRYQVFDVRTGARVVLPDSGRLYPFMAGSGSKLILNVKSGPGAGSFVWDGARKVADFPDADAEFSRFGKFLTVNQRNRSYGRVLRSAELQEVARFEQGFVRVSNSERIALATTPGGGAILWDLDAGRVRTKLTLPGLDRVRLVTDALLSGQPDNNSVQLIDAASGKALATHARYSNADAATDGQMILLWPMRGRGVYGVARADRLSEVTPIPERQSASAQPAPNGMLVFYSNDDGVSIRDVTGQITKLALQDVTVTEDGHRFSGRTPDRTRVRVIETVSGRTVCDVPIRSFVTTPEGVRYASVVKPWISSDGSLLAIVDYHRDRDSRADPGRLTIHLLPDPPVPIQRR